MKSQIWGPESCAAAPTTSSGKGKATVNDSEAPIFTDEDTDAEDSDGYSEDEIPNCPADFKASYGIKGYRPRKRKSKLFPLQLDPENHLLFKVSYC